MSFTFEKLPVYQRVVDFAEHVCTLSGSFPRGHCFLTDRDTDFLAIAVHREKIAKGESLPGRVFVAGPDWGLLTYECDGRLPR